MGCYATCSVATDRKGMGHVLKALGEKDAERKICEANGSGDPMPSKYTFDAIPHVIAYGDTYVATFAMSRSSRGFLMELQDMAGRLPEGEYGISYSFAWDYEPDLVAVNTDYHSYRGGGAELPWHLHDLSECYMDASYAKEKVTHIKWRPEDMEGADLQHVADAESLRSWVALHEAGAGRE